MLNRDVERMAAGQKPYKPDYVKCVGCGSEWFETLVATRFDANQTSDLGQAPMEQDKFFLLKCLKCGDMQEPPLFNNAMSPLRKDYDSLLDTLEEGNKKEETDGTK